MFFSQMKYLDNGIVSFEMPAIGGSPEQGEHTKSEGVSGVRMRSIFLLILSRGIDGMKGSECHSQ